MSNANMFYKGAITNNGKETELSHNLNLNKLDYLFTFQ